MKISKLIESIQITETNIDDFNEEVTSITSDSRQIKDGGMFICIRGLHRDGHDYIEAAIENKASVIVVDSKYIESNVNIIKNKIQYIAVEDTRLASSLFWNNWYEDPTKDMKIVAVTGTNGKTSTTYIIREILRSAGYKTGLIGTVRCLLDDEEIYTGGGSELADFPSAMTTPDPQILLGILRKMKDMGAEAVVMEASSHALALYKIDALKIDVGLFTNLSPEHLDFHGTMDEYFAAKARLFNLTKTGIINGDDEYAQKLLSLCPDCNFTVCSAPGIADGFVAENADVKAEEYRSLGVDGTEYMYKSLEATFRIRCRIPGSFTVYNTMLAACCALKLGVDLVSVQDAIRDMNGIEGRIERIKLDSTVADFSVFIDYAHTPAALETLLKTARAFRKPGQKITLLFGCGGDRDTTKRSPMGAIASKYADFVIITSDNCRTENPDKIIEQIMEGVDRTKPHIVIQSRRDAIRYAVKNAEPDEIILLAGKGHEKYEIDIYGKHPFDEAEIAREAAAELR